MRKKLICSMSVLTLFGLPFNLFADNPKPVCSGLQCIQTQAFYCDDTISPCYIPIFEEYTDGDPGYYLMDISFSVVGATTALPASVSCHDENSNFVGVYTIDNFGSFDGLSTGFNSTGIVGIPNFCWEDLVASTTATGSIVSGFVSYLPRANINEYFSGLESTSSSSSFLYGDWLLVNLVIIFILSFLMWGYLFSPFKPRYDR